MLSNLSNFKQNLHFPFSNHDGSQEEALETDITTGLFKIGKQQCFGA